MTGRNVLNRAALVALLMAALSGPAEARNIDLATVPPRDEVQLTIYNSEDLTLVRETRSLTLRKGLNCIQYSWAGTLIDPTSLEIRPLEKEDAIEILDTTYFRDKPGHCIWNIESKQEGQVRFMVSYFTSGLSWSADYVLVANPGETEMSFDGYVQIFNRSGEEYENAQVRLVVGVVNLVEKIRDLAQPSMPPPASAPQTKARGQAELKRAVEKADGKLLADEEDERRPPEIIKEGLSEYFIYTIEGRQTIPNQWSKRLASFRARQVKFDVLYRLRPHQYGPRPIRFYLLKNDVEHKLGTTPLPDGVVRTFRDNSRDGLSFMGQQSVKYVPIKEDIELKLGTDDQVIEELKSWKVERFNFAFSRDPRPVVIGWDELRTLSEEIRNYRDRAIRMEIRHQIPGDIELEAELAKLHDYRTVEFTLDVPAGKKLPWQFRWTEHLGENKKQDSIKLKQAVVD